MRDSRQDDVKNLVQLDRLQHRPRYRQLKLKLSQKLTGVFFVVHLLPPEL